MQLTNKEQELLSTYQNWLKENNLSGNCNAYFISKTSMLVFQVWDLQKMISETLWIKNNNQEWKFYRKLSLHVLVWMKKWIEINSIAYFKMKTIVWNIVWRMGHEIRTIIWNQDAGFIDDGTVQMDEMYLSHVGFKKQGRSLLNKTLIVGVYEKTSNKIIVKVLKKAKSKNLLWFALKHISTGCCLFTDSWKGYGSFKNFYHKHEIVNHEVGYVSSTGVNTNQIESAWKHIRRTFRTHIKVSNISFFLNQKY